MFLVTLKISHIVVTTALKKIYIHIYIYIYIIYVYIYVNIFISYVNVYIYRTRNDVSKVFFDGEGAEKMVLDILHFNIFYSNDSLALDRLHAPSTKDK